MSAIKDISNLVQREPPQYEHRVLRPRKRESTPYGRHIVRRPSSKLRKQSFSQEGGRRERASTSRVFIKDLSPVSVHTARYCRLYLPVDFIRKHKVDHCVTMTDSAGLKIWHMRFQRNRFFGHRKQYAISNGWREFSFEHSLKVSDRLVFTMVSSSHFVVEFATSDGSARAMYPSVREAKDYPWIMNPHRLEFLTSVHLQAEKEKLNREIAQGVQEQQIRKKVDIVKQKQIREKAELVKEKQTIRKKIQVVIEREIPQKVSPATLPNLQTVSFSQCNSLTHEIDVKAHSRKESVFPELTHIECKNLDGSLYLQILDSDSDS